MTYQLLVGFFSPIVCDIFFKYFEFVLHWTEIKWFKNLVDFDILVLLSLY